MAEIGWQVWGTPANFNEFRILASLLHWRRSTEVNQALHDIWPSPALVHCVHFWGCCPLMEFCQVQNSLPVQVLCSPILASLLYGIRAVGISQTLQRGTRNRITTLSLLVIFNRVCNLYTEGGRHVGIGPYSSFPYLSFPLRLDPFSFQAGGHKRRQNLGFISCFSLFYVVVFLCFWCAPCGLWGCK